MVSSICIKLGMLIWFNVLTMSPSWKCTYNWTNNTFELSFNNNNKGWVGWWEKENVNTSILTDYCLNIDVATEIPATY